MTVCSFYVPIRLIAEFDPELPEICAFTPVGTAVGMNRASACRLRERPGAKSFATAWDRAIGLGQSRMWKAAMERALTGVTAIRVHRGGSASLTGGPDMRLIHSALADRGSLARQRRQI